MAQDTGTRSVALVIFDCDGVLVDSEAATCGLCAQAARDAGMVVSDEDSIETFSGMALPLIRTMIERETGSTLAPDWTAMMQARFVAAMEKGARPVPGVYTMLDTVRAMGLPMRVGTNSSMEEMTVKFAATNLGPYFGDRIHSAVDVGAPKPRPDIYLTAARHEGVPPHACVVLEDSLPGAQAALAAGMTCVMLVEAGKNPPDLSGVLRIEHLSEFPAVLERLSGQG
ncbi:HAD family hydrolase [Acetobacter peroxydans]|jgi:HAD superfamily hydrolase (TIGR01509 family)|uniref:HAD family hydrolase n=1 Tax=Acetobacter peroxydans TaxID=104098 RepID=UPI002355DDEC|nr:HAD family phosphatase [Acetobacter peroxydans]MCH4143921.1 HAD family phosphatase [Acetobacter peroxydans]MCI1394873.1 HAD family phosphatase [Acetobacter peroxydans]MCI1412141.1 HAD family phosphatase [Acetobacter peroxydans]MCI1439485.1 HAD family phosphatase [Acetobacter peroxydans]MCI1567434.1 HAD family phosphatase [Acetobacter peroxydans]